MLAGTNKIKPKSEVSYTHKEFESYLRIGLGLATFPAGMAAAGSKKRHKESAGRATDGRNQPERQPPQHAPSQSNSNSMELLLHVTGLLV